MLLSVAVITIVINSSVVTMLAGELLVTIVICIISDGSGIRLKLLPFAYKVPIHHKRAIEACGIIRCFTHGTAGN